MDDASLKKIVQGTVGAFYLPFVLIQEVKIRWMNMKLINNLVFLDFFWNEFLLFLS